MDLRPRLALAGTALLALLDPERDLMPAGGYEVAHDLGRWWDAVLRLEETAGLIVPADLEAASLRHLHALTDNPDRLLMNLGDAPWLSEKAKVNPHNFRESLLAFGGLARRRRNAWARRAGLQLIAAMENCLGDDGYFDQTRLGSWGLLPATGDPTHTEGPAGSWTDSTATTGRSLEAVVWFHQSTGEDRALGLARRLAERHLARTISADGQVRAELLDSGHAGHTHSYLGTLRGLLLFGLATGQRACVDAVEASYRQGVCTQVVTEAGWAPHDLGLLRFPNEAGDPVADPASCGDAAQLALWLARDAGHVDLFDHVERYVRSRLVPAQLTPQEARTRATEDHGRALGPRDIGAWAIHGPSHGGKGCTPDVLAAVAHSLCDIQSSACRQTDQGLCVDLHFDCETEEYAVSARRDERGQVCVRVHRPMDVRLRIPGWAPRDTLTLTVNGRDAAVTRLGHYAWVPAAALGPGGVATLAYDLPRRTTEETMPSGRQYRFAWRADQIVGADPLDAPLPFYAPL